MDFNALVIISPMYITIHRHPCQTASVLMQQQLSADTGSSICCHSNNNQL